MQSVYVHAGKGGNDMGAFAWVPQALLLRNKDGGKRRKERSRVARQGCIINLQNVVRRAHPPAILNSFEWRSGNVKQTKWAMCALLGYAAPFWRLLNHLPARSHVT